MSSSEERFCLMPSAEIRAIKACLVILVWFLNTATL
jgi:hypothetical protein